jgi:3-dehydroquinate synthase
LGLCPFRILGLPRVQKVPSVTASKASSADRDTVPVALGSRSYEIVIATGRLDTWAQSLDAWRKQRWGESGAGKALVVSDLHVAKPHAETVLKSLGTAGWQTGRIDLEPGEQAKALAVVSRLYDALVALKADRRSVVVAVGGGVVGDTAGFAAATYARGIPLIQIPTTLLAQVDSSVGGKVGINHPQGKNLIGAFHQPLGVFIDTATLETLPDRDYRSGLAEVVKYGVILDGAFFDYLEVHVEGLNRREPDVLRRVIARSCQLKANVVEKDEYETTGLRALLNYGHTFAHAYEALIGYGELQHGEAVAIGMIHASRLAERLGRIDRSLTERQIELLGALHLPTGMPAKCRLEVDAVLERMQLDKKTLGGTIRFVLPTRIGHVELVETVPAADVRAVLEHVL